MGRVLKSADGNRTPAVVATASDQARAILDAAERDAASLLRAAEAQATAMTEDAAAHATARLHALAARAEAELDVLAAQRRSEIAELAVGVGEKLATRAFEADPALVDGLIRDAAAKLSRSTVFRVRVAETDVERVATTFPAFEVVADAALAPGEAVVESSVGRVDARIAVRLDAIRRALGLEGAT